MGDNLIELRDTFREIADIIDEILELEKREKEGQDVKKELESVMGRYLLKFIELQALSNS
ncbi:hypothetical protein ACQPVP_08855 [Clostridium nigeriense]|uniref:hypothetical protein n=1 Tax=Clostridium nigeriense TaxID=1805470 RepID=UPI003D3299AC